MPPSPSSQMHVSLSPSLASLFAPHPLYVTRVFPSFMSLSYGLNSLSPSSTCIVLLRATNSRPSSLYHLHLDWSLSAMTNVTVTFLIQWGVWSHFQGVWRHHALDDVEVEGVSIRGKRIDSYVGTKGVSQVTYWVLTITRY